MCVLIGVAIGAIAGGIAGAVISKNRTGKVNGWAIAGGIFAGGAIGAGLGWLVSGFSAAGALGSGTLAQLGREIYENWQGAEAGLKNAIGSVADYGSRILSTPYGNRVVDAFNTKTNVIAEAKYGYQSLSTFIQSEIAKDAWLLQNGVVEEVQWHFYLSQASGSIGGSVPLIKALIDVGIQVFYH